MQKSSLRRGFKVYPSSFYEQVTFNSRQSANQALFTAYTIYRAKRRTIDDEEKLARGLLGVSVLAWLLDKEHLDEVLAPAPKPRDQIVDSSGVVWIVNEKGVEVKLLGAVYELTCQKAPG